MRPGSRGMAPQSTATKGFPARRLPRWISCATCSLPVPLAPFTSTDMSVGGHQPHVFVELPRRVAAPLDVVERFGRRAPGRARGVPAGPSGFLPGCRGVERLADLLQQFVGVHGFGHVVARAEFHAPHGVPYLGVARHHDHRSRDALAGHPLQQGDPSSSGRRMSLSTRGVVAFPERRAGRCRRTGRLHLEAPVWPATCGASARR